MATLFQSFRSSTMPKRLLRYALSRLELLDSDAINLDNLDLALGRNTVLEFRDVAIRLKKLEKLLQLPTAFKLQKAKVLLLRVTIPMDFYTSPITIDVDGVDITLQVLASEPKSTRTPGTKTPDEQPAVPHAVDLAQSFLETQPSSERKQLEEALAAETQDLGASVSVSDDGSEDDLAFGTGQALTLPAFLADFLQGIVDRMQVKINAVTFQLDVEVPVEPGSTTTEPVGFQIALEGIDIEGVTVSSQQHDDSTIIPKEGKRHIALANIRAYLVSEANVFSSLARSPSMTSPSVASSPVTTRSGPVRQPTPLSQGSFHDEPMASLQESFRERLSNSDEIARSQSPLADSEDALGIPYEFSAPPEDENDESPATPRASMYHDFTSAPPEESMFHSTILSAEQTSHSLALDEAPMWASLEAESRSEPAPSGLPFRPSASEASLLRPPDEHMESSTSSNGSFGAKSTEDLTQSLMYTHEEAESMYMSAFSQKSAQASGHSASNNPADDTPTEDVAREMEEAYDAMSGSIAATETETEQASQEASVADVEADSLEEKTTEARPATPPRPETPKGIMPGSWGDDESPPSKIAASANIRTGKGISERHNSPGTQDNSDSDSSSPAFSRACITDVGDDIPTTPKLQQDDAPTPKGPTRLVKEILNLKKISIYVPSQHQHIHVQQPSHESVAQLGQSLNRSVYPQAPGAFSVHGAAPVPNKSKETPSSNADNALEVSLSPISINFDASLGFLFAMVVGKLLEATKGNSDTSQQGAKEKEKSPSRNTPEIRVLFEELSLNFLNRLGGVADTPERFLDPLAFITEHEVLLKASLKNLAIAAVPTEIPTKQAGRGQESAQLGILTKIDLQEFRFGYANGDIVSFDNNKPMSTSVRDTFLSSGSDIGLRISQTAETTHVDIETMPLVVQIDLQRLDETFSWFGGLSSFLNMSASMASSSSPAPKPTALPAPKPRAVRFDTPIDPQDKSALSQNKVNLRIGGALLELVGKECSVAAETSAIKMVSRGGAIGMSCSMLRVSGLLVDSPADPSIITDVGGVRLEFLTSPQDSDLERLIELIIPSKVKFDKNNDEIMVDTLLRQRRKGSVLRATIDTVNVRVHNMSQLSLLPNLAEEIGKLANVAKYLPEDDRPGLLTLGKIQKVGVSLDFGDKLGHFDSELRDLHVGQITMPSLFAVATHGISVKRNKTEELVASSITRSSEVSLHGPVLMARMIGDEMEPVIKLKMQDLCVEYRVPTIMDLLDLSDDATPQDFEASLAASIVDLRDQAQSAIAGRSSPLAEKPKTAKPLTLDIGFRDCLIGLNPLGQPSKMVVALTDAHLLALLPQQVESNAVLNINKASILLIDDVSRLTSPESAKMQRPRDSASTSPQVSEMCAQGYVDICYISSAKAVLDVKAGQDGSKQLNVDLKDDLLVLETCADSTQTLISLTNSLTPPTPPSKENKYRTSVIPVQDLLASISAEAFGKPEGEYDFDQDFAGAEEMAGSGSDAGYSTDSPLHVESQFYEDNSVAEELFDATSSSILAQNTDMKDIAEGVLVTGLDPTTSQNTVDSDGLELHEDYYGNNASAAGTAKVWNSKKNTYDRAPADLVRRSPLSLSVRDVNVIWNLFDGYDWENTRDVISKAVHDVEAKAYERQARAGQAYEEEFEDEEAIGDFLFNSIYIGIPANRDPQELAQAINEGLNDNATETESVATTAFTASTNRTARARQPKSRRLRLKRSKRHKITFELKGVDVDLIAFPPDSGETVSSIDVRVKALDIFDHVPTSTWKKFATYDQDMGEREMGSSMVHIEILNVKPQPSLAASEIVLRASVLPLRLHVDQDALDFITRFFEFKDDSVPVHASKSDVPFLQRAEVNDVPVKLDFKPKRVDYAGLRSGHTTEFMNFIVLQEARLTLRHIIIYGVSGFDRLGKILNDSWTPDVRANQLPGVLAGLAPVRSIVNVGSGFKDLVEIPLREYKKDGRVIRSISKGAAAFARTTGTELVKLGAKLAVGTQYALQGAEDMLSEGQQAQSSWDDDDLDEEDKRQISLYADQPTGVVSGIRSGYRSLTRDVNLARDAIIAVPGEVMVSQSASGAARAVWKRAPTIIFRPAVGVTKVIGQTLMGATNSIDPHNQRRIDEKYKKH